MISRGTTVEISELTCSMFINSATKYVGANRKITYSVDINRLYDFLYKNDYESWFCNLAKKYTGGYSSSLLSASRNLKEFILRLHTGETLAESTPKWGWKQRQKLGQEYLKNLAEDILNDWEDLPSEARGYEKYGREEKVKACLAALELNGYRYKDRKLFAPESDVLDLQEEAGVLQDLINSLQLEHAETVMHHLKLTEEHYLNEKWDDSISNSRKFLEAILQQVAKRFSASKKEKQLPRDLTESPMQVRGYLQGEGLIEKKETELIAKTYSLLSHQGGHPYMAKKDQARLLRHFSLTICQFVLLRLQGSLKT